MAKHIHKAVPNIARPALERFGFAYAEILNHWPLIVGQALAACSAPERIRWPAQKQAENARTRRRTGGTLIVRVADGRAVELQHQTPTIIDRVNTYYGYQAVTAVKLVQGLLPDREPRAPRRPSISPERAAALDAELGTVEDEALRQALMRLGRGALARPPGKGH